MTIIEKLEAKEAVIGIVGLGYVGFPLLLAYAANGYRCIGFDVDQYKIDHIKAGKGYIDHIDTSALKTAVDDGIIDATLDFARISDVDAVIICVPTPLNRHLEPDLSYVTGTMD